MKQELTPQQANKLAIEQQVIYIKQLIVALKFEFKGESWLLGQVVDAHTLAMAQKRLTELDRVQQIYESDKYAKLPYVNSNGGNDKMKVHFNTTGTVKFVEGKEGASVKEVDRHVNSKQVSKKQLSIFSKHNKQSPSKVEATKMATKTKKPSKQTLKAQKQPYAVKGKTNAERIRDAYYKNPKTFNVAEFAAKSGIPYNLVYGCITKEKAKGTSAKKNSKPKKANKAKKATAAAVAATA